MKRIALLVQVVLVGSCATVPDPISPIVSTQADKTAFVWIQDDPEMPADVILAGCAYWNPLKIRCERTFDLNVAHVRVYANKEKCEDKEHHKLAWAHPSETRAGRKIEMITDCMKGLLGRPDRDKMRAVFAHELGHELGIWEHVPSVCDDESFTKERDEYDTSLKLKTHPSGKKICGTAVMNPWNHNLPWLTEFDRLAFDVRSPYWRAIEFPGKPPADWKGCTLYPHAK